MRIIGDYNGDYTQIKARKNFRFIFVYNSVFVKLLAENRVKALAKIM